MKWLESIPWLAGSSALVLLVATIHLRRGSGPVAKAVGSLLLFLLTAVVVSLSGFHHCDEGSAPPFVVLSAALAAASLPWILLRGPWILRGLIAVVVSAGMLTAGTLSSSYHRDDITGNPKYSSGRFWHTAFTGQYPRDLSRTFDLTRVKADGAAGRQAKSADAGPLPALIPQLALDDGKRWMTDDHTRESIGRMKRLIETTPADSLGQALSGEINRLFSGCRLEGEAHAQLHLFLGELLARVNGLYSSESPEERASETEAIEDLLAEYDRYFE